MQNKQISFLDNIKSFQKEFNPLIEEYFQSKYSEFSDISDFSLYFYKVLEEFTLRGGKRLRPALIYNTYLMYNDKKLEDVMKLSLFVELIQSWLLINDDIMDNDDLRRGKPTVHKIFEKYANENNYINPKHFGTSLAICCGGLASQLYTQIITDSNFDDNVKIKILKVVTNLVNQVNLGQITDVESEYMNSVSEEDIYNIHYFKTAKYTYEIPINVGLILANAPQEDYKYLNDYSKYAGIAFQIRDDVLGIFGDQSKTGKSDYSDIKEGKKTLLTLKATENASELQKDQLIILLGKKDLTEGEADIFREIITETGSLKYSVEICEKYITDARKSLSKLKTKNNEGWKFLDQIAEFTIIRDY